MLNDGLLVGDGLVLNGVEVPPPPFTLEEDGLVLNDVEPPPPAPPAGGVLEPEEVPLFDNPSPPVVADSLSADGINSRNGSLLW